MKDVIKNLEQELGIPFYYISREEDQVPVGVYNYKKELNISDMKKESAVYDFYFLLIINTKINATVEKFEEILRYPAGGPAGGYLHLRRYCSF